MRKKRKYDTEKKVALFLIGKITDFVPWAALYAFWGRLENFVDAEPALLIVMVTVAYISGFFMSKVIRHYFPPEIEKEPREKPRVFLERRFGEAESFWQESDGLLFKVLEKDSHVFAEPILYCAKCKGAVEAVDTLLGSRKYRCRKCAHSVRVSFGIGELQERAEQAFLAETDD